MNDRSEKNRDSGTAVVLILVYSALGFAIAMAAAAATELYLFRQQLWIAAEATALAAADSASLTKLSVETDTSFEQIDDDGPVFNPLQLTELAVLNQAQRFVDNISSYRFDIDLVHAEVVDNVVARVTVQGEWRSMVLPSVYPASVVVTATSSATTMLVSG